MYDEYEKTVSYYSEKDIKTKKQNENINKDSYFLTIINEDKINSINISEFNKKKITFGRKDDNDIVIDSVIVSGNHGYFQIKNGELIVFDNDSTNGIFYDNKLIKEKKLSDGDFLKIDNPNIPLNRGIMFIISHTDRFVNWNHFDLTKNDKIVIGRSKECNIVLKHVGVSKKHAYIYKENDDYYIEDNNSTNKTSVNGQVIKDREKLKEKDVILITNSMLIYSKGRLIYQSFDKGVKVNACDLVKTVHIKNGSKDILSHISMNINPSEFVALVGGSGAGKSTFMNSISGFTKPTSGVVLINDVDLYDNYSVLKNIIGYVPQQDIVYTNLRLYDMLRYASDLRMPEDSTDEEKENQINLVLKIVDLSDHKDTYIKQLSGGQRKRASIAVELLADPSLFFLDEPTSGLDPGTERSVMKTLKEMAKSGKTVILVTHNTLNLHLCDKVAFIGKGGKLCFFGDPKNALNFFGVNDFVDIYSLLNEDTNTWHDRFVNTDYSIQNEELVISSNIEEEYLNRKSFLKQLKTLTSRYMKIILNDKSRLALLLLQAPIIAFLLYLVSSDGTFKNYDDTKAILFSISCSCIWLGLLNSIQEICKERVILKKEYMADLKLSSYIISKVIIQSLLAFVQAFILISVYAIFVRFPTQGIIINSYFDYLLSATITIISASSIGIFVSSIAKSTNVAMSVAPLILVPQLLFSGMLFSLKGFSNIISNLVLCRFSVSSFGTIANLNSMPNKIFLIGVEREAENYFTFTSSNYFNLIFIMLGMSLIMLIGTFYVLKKQLNNQN